MAITFTNIAIAEPSTVTARLASVQIARGSTNEQQELLTIADPQSSLGLVRVTDTTPDSTMFGLVVREAVPQSTVMTVSTGSVRVHQSSAGDLNVTVANLSTTVAVSSIAGPVTVRSSAANLLASVYQSSAADLNVTVANLSTTVAVSSIAGPVTVRSSAANALVTGYQSTYTDLNANVRLSDRDNSTATAAIVNGVPASTAYGLVVRMPSPINDSTNNALRVNVVAGAAGGSTDVSVSQLRDSSGGTVTAADSANNAIRVNVVAGAAGGSTIVTVSTGSVNVAGVVDSSNALVKPGDSDNNAIRVNVVAGAAGGSTLATVRQSTYTELQTLSGIRDRDQSTQVAAVLGTAPASTTYGIVTRDLSTGPFAVSSIAGPVTVRSSAANALMTAYQSSAADLQVTTTWASSGNTVLARVTTSSGGGVEGSTTAPAVGVTGLHVRQVFPTMQSTTVVITSSHSTAIYPVISSAAGLRHKVYAYFVGSTHTNPSTLIFCSSASASGFDHWSVNFGSGSSGITGANLAVQPPGFIFAGIVANALNVRVEGGSSAASTVVVRIALAWFDEA